MLNILPFIILQAWGLWPEFSSGHDDMMLESLTDGEGRDREFEDATGRYGDLASPSADMQESQTSRVSETRLYSVIEAIRSQARRETDVYRRERF